MSELSIASLACMTARRLALLFVEDGDWDSVQALVKSLNSVQREDIAKFLQHEATVDERLVKALLDAGCLSLDLQLADDDFSLSDLPLGQLTELNLSACPFFEPEHFFGQIPCLQHLQIAHLSALTSLDDASIRVCA